MSSKAARGKTAAAKSAAASAAGVHDPKKMKHNQSGRYNDRRRPNVYDTYEEYSKAEIECPGCKQDPPRTREKKGGGKYKWCCYSCSKIRKNPYLKNWKPQAGRVSSKAGRKRKVNISKSFNVIQIISPRCNILYIYILYFMWLL